ncbi:MAG TPA: hypothetical protein VMU39_06540 [Solirubrobacteraceae bacterium]|nr:hypothetical protein [Solirubrobacteraceae bacterium]
MTTHMSFDPYLNEETPVEIRHPWEGAVPLRRARRVVVNVTKDDICVRAGVLSDHPNARAHQLGLDDGPIVVPAQPNKIVDIQEPAATTTVDA